MTDEHSHKKNIIVIGTSAGGNEALGKVLSKITPHLNATIFIVQHLRENGDELLSIRLNNICPLSVTVARDQEVFKKGHVYVAPSDKHMLLHPGVITLTRGPQENRSRPSIDVLFRSAAVHYSAQVIGVILTGRLTDGAIGLKTIKECGGTTIVQDPLEAAEPDMPLSALQATSVDYRVSLDEIPELLGDLSETVVLNRIPVPHQILLEADVVENHGSTTSRQEELGELAGISCPECGGPLSEISDTSPKRYRCRIGHAYSAFSLSDEQGEQAERALWSAVRILEEREKVLLVLAGDSRGRGHDQLAKRYQDRAEQVRKEFSQVRALVIREDAQNDEKLIG